MRHALFDPMTSAEASLHGVGEDGWVSDIFVGRQSHSGETVTPQSSLALSAYYACINIISEDVAKLPLILYRRTTINGEDGKVRATELPLYDLLLSSPNSETTSISFRQTVQALALGWGNGYAEIQKDGGDQPVALNLVHSSRVIPVRVKVNPDNPDDRETAIFYVIRNNDGTTTTLPAADMFHIRGYSEDGLVGLSAVHLAPDVVGLGLAAQTFGASFFRNGARMGGILSYPGHMKRENKEANRKSWESAYGGAKNAGKTAVLWGGAKYQMLSIPPKEAQYVESRKFQVEEIARWFRVPQHKIGHLDKATFSNIEEQSQEYFGDALMPWMVRWEQEIQAKLIGPSSDLFAEHLDQALLRGDPESRAAFMKDLFNMGMMTINEGRRLENMNPLPGRENNITYMQLNMAPVEKIAAPPEPEPLAVAAPADGNTDHDDGNTGHEDDDEPDAKLEAAHELAIEQVAGRMLRKEAKDETRAAKKEGASKWRALFFGHAQERAMIEALAPSVIAYCLALKVEPGQEIAHACHAYCRARAAGMGRPTSEQLADYVASHALGRAPNWIPEV